MSSIKTGELEIRQKGGALATRWTKYYCVLQTTQIGYWDSMSAYRGNPKSPIEGIPLSTVSEVLCLKSKGVTGFMFQVKTSTSKTQHLSQTDEERQDWMNKIIKASNGNGQVTTSPSTNHRRENSNVDDDNNKSLKQEIKQQHTEDKKENNNKFKKEEINNNSNTPKEEIENNNKLNTPKGATHNRSTSRGEEINKKNTREYKQREEQDVEYTNNSGTMVITKTAKDLYKDRKIEKIEKEYENNTGTMVITKPQIRTKNSPKTPKKEEDIDYANSSGTMVITKTAKAITKTAKATAKKSQKASKEEFTSMSIEQLTEWKESKLEKKYLKDCDRAIRKWKEEKSLVLDTLRKKEIERIESLYQRLQLELEQARQEKKETLTNLKVV